MCPVDPVCHQLACYRRLFSLSRTRNRRFIALFTPIDFAMSATPTSQLHYLYMYGTRDVSRGGVRSTRIRFMWLRFTNFSPCVR